MSIALSLSTFALRQVVDGACAAVGMKGGGEAVVGFLVERFTDHSQRLSKALQNANDNAWTALEIALAGDSLWERCKSSVARAEDKAFAQQVRAFLDATPLPELARKAAFRQKCLEELRAARKGQALTAGTLDSGQLAQRTVDFARFSNPQSLLDAEWRMVISLASQVKESGFPSLAWLLSQRSQHGMPILVVAVRYFFRRAIENDHKLFQGLSFAKLEALGEVQERGFASLSAALTEQGQRLEELLRGVQAVVVQTHSVVLDLQGQMKGQGEQIEQIGQAVMQLLEQHQLQRREVRPGDSLSIHNEGERQLVKQLVARYRSLPEGQRQNVPSLLNAIGKLEVVAGDLDQAQRDFQVVATMVDDTKTKAEAHFNAYQTALERRDLGAAMREFIEAVKLDAKQYAPFPVGKYHPLLILGAGGFGTAFLCRHKYMNAEVVVKALHLEALGRDTDKVFTEAQVLRQFDHPAIIRISECGYVDASSKDRPHIIMDYFQGQTLESYVKEHGPLAVENLLVVARQVAEGLQAAHGAKILHRDVKPANLLVRKEVTGWKVKIIDFGLAMPQKVVETSQKGGTPRQKETMIGSSIAGTMDYGAPEQMGRRKEPIGAYSDVYGWAKTCCYALFQTAQPLPKHWKSVPEPLAELLEKCLEEDTKKRPSGFAEVLKCLTLRECAVAPAAPSAIGPEQRFDFESAAVAAPGVTTTRKKSKRSLLPWVLGGLGLLAVALVMVFGFMLGGQMNKGLEMAEANPGNPSSKGTGELVKGQPRQATVKDMPPTSDKGAGELVKGQPAILPPKTEPKVEVKMTPVVSTEPTNVDTPTAKKDGVSFTENKETFKSCWRRGDNRGSYFYDPAKKSVHIESPWDLGSLTHKGEWKVFAFEVEVKALSFGNFDVSINRTTLRFGPALTKGKGRQKVTIEYDSTAETVVAKVNGAEAARASVDANWSRTFQCSFSSNGGGTADVNFYRMILDPGDAAQEKLLQTDKLDTEFEVTSELVKKRFHGKATYNSKAGVLILVYDFKTRDQLDDFDLMGSKPKLRNGNLMLEGGESILHVAKFKTLTLNTTVSGKPDDYFIKIRNTCGFWTRPTEVGGIGLAVLDEQGKPTEDMLDRRWPTGAIWPVEMIVTRKRLGLKVGTIQLGKTKDSALAGQVELTGGKKGSTFHGLVLEGTLDAAWEQEFFTKRKQHDLPTISTHK